MVSPAMNRVIRYIPLQWNETYSLVRFFGGSFASSSFRFVTGMVPLPRVCRGSACGIAGIIGGACFLLLDCEAEDAAEEEAANLKGGIQMDNLDLILSRVGSGLESRRGFENVGSLDDSGVILLGSTAGGCAWLAVEIDTDGALMADFSTVADCESLVEMNTESRV